MSTIIIVKVTTTTPTKTTRITDKVNKTITTTIMEARILMVTEIIKDNIIITITATTTTRAISQDQRATAGKITADPNRILDHLTMTRAETTINLSRNNSTNQSSNLNTFLREL